MSAQNPLIVVNELKKHFRRTKGFTRRIVGTVKAVDGASLHIDPSETLALVGESGSGKTTLGRTILRAIEPTSGSIQFDFEGNGDAIDLMALEKDELKRVRQNMAMIFQDPYSSLNPRMSVLEIVGEPFRNYRLIRETAQLRQRVGELLELVRLDPEYMTRYPHAFSGGQRQRIAIARALALHPKFVVADEPVSALDVSVQAQILNLMRELQEEFRLTYLFVAHNLAVIEYITDRCAVMYLGKIVELGDTKELFLNPRHPYTEALLSAVPKGDPDIQGRRIILQGDIPDPANRPTGCAFHPRCPYVKDICRSREPELKEALGTDGSEHISACHFQAELQLAGVVQQLR